MLAARQLWERSVPLKGSLGETYLVEHRGIHREVIDRLAFAFVDEGSDADCKQQLSRGSPAVLVPVLNTSSQLTGEQRIYHDGATGGRSRYGERHKFSLGTLKGSCGMVQHQPGSNDVYVVEGPETGAAVACAVGPQATVVASLSLGNVANVGGAVAAHNPERVILALDSDLSPEVRAACDRAVNKVRSTLDGFPVEVRYPSTKKRTQAGMNADWNDVLVEEGLHTLREQLGVPC